MGSFGLSRDDYDIAVKSLSSLPLSSFDSQEGESRTHLQTVISFYKSLSKQELVCVRDLFTLLMHLIHEHHKSFSKPRDDDFHERGLFEDGVLHPWNRNNVEKVKASMIKVVRAISRSNWVSSRALRGAVCRMASPELLDYCLEGLEGGFTADGMVVSSCCTANPVPLNADLNLGLGN
ncbi:hypothetical protein MLD38_016268 [Melastoma candidum]|uniref:Uncharacterized protein n=1 Tax=Melastoma candidum TaxID=119954 RepID=A0ACB9RI51_9MYRT|nr:hypothetical protein MLD38_016268 [Melastoma candidum]